MTLQHLAGHSVTEAVVWRGGGGEGGGREGGVEGGITDGLLHANVAGDVLQTALSTD